MTTTRESAAAGSGAARFGVVTGAAILIGGLGLQMVAQLRPTGLGVTRVLARNPHHLQAIISIFGGAVPIILSLLWHIAGGQTRFFRRLHRWVILVTVLSALSAALTLLTNWLIVTGLTSDHIALFPALTMLATAVIYLLVAHPLSGATAVNLGARLVLRSSYLWLVITASLQLIWVAARVFEHHRMLWFLERPTLETALLGFVLFGALGLLLTGLPTVSHSRDLIRTMVRSYQAANALVFGWGAMQAWAIRFPGSLQGLLLALVGVGLLLCCLLIAEGSTLLTTRVLQGGAAIRHSDDLLGAVAIVLAIATTLLLAVTAVVAAASSQMPPTPLFSAVFACAGIGLLAFTFGAVVLSYRGRLDFPMAAGTLLLALGALSTVTIWATIGLVERSLQLFLLASEGLMAAGLLLMLLSVLFIDIPTTHV